MFCGMVLVTMRLGRPGPRSGTHFRDSSFSGNVAKLSTKSARDSSESSICSSKCLKKGVRSTFGRSGRRDVNQTVARARFALPDCSESLISPRQCKKLTRSEQLRICVVKSARLTLRELWLICCDTPAMRVCNRL